MTQRLTSTARVALVVGSAALVTACASGPTADPRDPMEPFNRAVYGFNNDMDMMFLKPTATVYKSITPTPVQTGVSNFFNNLSDAWSAVNSALQGKGQEAMNNFWRFTINSTFGLGGIFDVASEAQIPRVKQDFGLTLGHWGVKPGPYVVLPLLGPSTLRDTVATPVDMYGGPLGAVNESATRNALTGLGMVDRRAQLLEATDILETGTLDPYLALREAYFTDRKNRVSGHNTPEVAQAAANDGYEPPIDGGDTPAPAASAAPAAKNTSAPAQDLDGYEPPIDDMVDPAQAAAPQKEPAGEGAVRNDRSPFRGASTLQGVELPQPLLRQINNGAAPSLWRR